MTNGSTTAPEVGNKTSTWIRLILIAASTAAVLLVSYSFPARFETWNDRWLDRLFTLPVSPPGAHPYRLPPLVHVDANFYLSRSDHARVIRQLTDLGARAIVVDHVFDGSVGGGEDRQLIESIRASGNVILGVAQAAAGNALARGQAGPSPTASALAALNASAPLSVDQAAAGRGFLHLTPDTDGILRRVAMVIRYGDDFYPSLALRSVCAILGVSPEEVQVRLGSAIVFEGDAESADLVIPIDGQGRAVIGLDPIGGRLPHLSYSEIFEAETDNIARSRLTRTLDGAVAILSETVEFPYRVRKSQRMEDMSSGMIHAALIRSALSGGFARQASRWEIVGISVAFLGVLFVLSMRFSSSGFFIGSVATVGGYAGLTVGVFILAGVLLPAVQSVLAMGLSAAAILATMGVEKALLLSRTEQARRMAERELEIGRHIQAGFFPNQLPELTGWEVAVHFEPARHVAGDFYDMFVIKGGDRVGVVIADVCDKGVGAALFMGLFRSLIRVLSFASVDGAPSGNADPAGDPATILERTVATVNDYIATTHRDEGMFATVFFGLLDPQSGDFDYINGGHEPPWIVGAGGVLKRLMPTGPAVGAFPSAAFEVHRIRLEPSQSLVGFTDGVLDAVDSTGEALGKERLADGIAGPFDTAGDLLSAVRESLWDHVKGQPPVDDITCLVLRRKRSLQQPTPVHGLSS